MSIDFPARADATRAEATPVIFSGEGGAFLRLTLAGAFLQLATLGFYRFWFVTNVRRGLWSSTAVDGDALEYTGRGRELLIGFLFAVAILAPIYIVDFIIGLEVERLKAFAGLPLFLVFFLFGQFAIFRARRYRLTRTVWRGARFWMTGSGVGYALRSSGWALLALVTLGALHPWRLAALERYKMRHTFYGDLQGRFEGTGWALFKAAGWIWGLCVALVLAPWSAMLGTIWLGSRETPGQEARIGASATDMVALLPIAAMLTPLIAVALWPVFQAIEWRWWLNGLRLGEVRFSSQFPRSRLVMLYLALFAIGLVIAILGVALVFVFHAVAMAFFGGGGGAMATLALVLIPIFYLAALALFGAFHRFFLQFKLWEAVMDSLAIHNLSAAASVAVRGGAVSALGEGLADGLDVAGF